MNKEKIVKWINEEIIGCSIRRETERENAMRELLLKIERGYFDNEASESKHYFLVYEWTRDGLSGWERSNVVLEKHPIEWLKEMKIDYEDRYRILFWEEIDKDKFDLIDGFID